MSRIRRTVNLVASVAVGLFGWAASVRGEVVGYTVEAERNDTVLTSVVVTRGKGTVAFDASKLIRATVTHFKSSHTRNVVNTTGCDAPSPELRARLLGDLKLTTGLINPGNGNLTGKPVLRGSQATPGVAVTFDRPVVNLPGDDVVLFEVQRGDSPAAGDAFRVGPVHWKPGLRAITVRAFDIEFDHPRAITVAQYVPYLFRQPAESLEDLTTQPLEAAFSPGGFKALPVGIDLTALGYADGAPVEGLFFQDADTPGIRVDPVLIAGLPLPEPPNILEKIPMLPANEKGQLLAKFLDGPMADLEEIVFAERVPGNDHWYANLPVQANLWANSSCGRLPRL